MRNKTFFDRLLPGPADTPASRTQVVARAKRISLHLSPAVAGADESTIVMLPDATRDLSNALWLAAGWAEEKPTD